MDFSPITNGIRIYLDDWEPVLLALPAETLTTRTNAQNRSIKQILGHLIDSAANNHQRMIRLQYNEQLDFPDYQQDNDLWIALQDYQHEDWMVIVQLWKYYNLHLIQLIQSVDPTKLTNRWQNFEKNTVTLQQMIEGYLGHMELHLGEIGELINK